MRRDHAIGPFSRDGSSKYYYKGFQKIGLDSPVIEGAEETGWEEHLPSLLKKKSEDMKEGFPG